MKRLTEKIEEVMNPNELKESQRLKGGSRASSSMSIKYPNDKDIDKDYLANLVEGEGELR